MIVVCSTAPPTRSGAAASRTTTAASAKTWRTATCARHGCTVVARNYRPPSGSGEIDLVAWHGGTLVFVEVKTRASAEFGAPERAVDAEKRGRLARAARDYARRAGVEWGRTRFDIVSIVLGEPRAHRMASRGIPLNRSRYNHELLITAPQSGGSARIARIA